jgi:hypothetical protein
VLAGALLAGIALFPRALEPGQAESDGIALNRLVDHGSATASNDWFLSRSDVGVTDRGGFLRIRATDVSGYQLISRPLPVFPHHRYAVEWEQRNQQGNWLVVVLDSRLRPTDPRTETGMIPRVGVARERYVFDTNGLRRITLAFIGVNRHTVDLRNIRLVRLD